MASLLVAVMVLTGCGSSEGKGNSDGAVEQKPGEYVITVTNGKGGVVSGASVALGSNVATTDSYGKATFADSAVPASTTTLRITCSGYMEYINEDYVKTGSGGDLIVINAESKFAHSISSAVYTSTKNGETETKDLTSFVKNVRKNDGIYFNISVTVSENADTVASYQICQTNEIIATSFNGKFNNLTANKFFVGGNVFVRVFSKDGGPYIDTPLYLNVQSAIDTPDPTTLKLMNDWSMEVGEDVPILGGSEIGLKMPDLPITFEISDDTIRVGFNVATDVIKDHNFSGDSNKWDSFKKIMTEATDSAIDEWSEDLDDSWSSMSDNFQKTIQAYQNRDLSKKFVSIANDEGDDDDDSQPSMNITGYAEASISEDGQISRATGCVAFVISGETEFGWQYIICYVPVTLKITLSAEGKVSATISYDFEQNKFMGDLGLACELGIDIKAGVGFKDVINGGIYGAASLSIEYGLGFNTGNQNGLRDITLHGEAGLYGYVNLWVTEIEKEYAIIEGDCNIYPDLYYDLVGSGEPGASVDDLTDLSKYKVAAGLVDPSVFEQDETEKKPKKGEAFDAEDAEIEDRFTISGNDELFADDDEEGEDVSGNDEEALVGSGVVYKALTDAGLSRLEAYNLTDIENGIILDADLAVTASGKVVLVYEVIDKQSAPGVNSTGNKEILKYTMLTDDGWAAPQRVTTSTAAIPRYAYEFAPDLTVDGEQVYLTYQILDIDALSSEPTEAEMKEIEKKIDIVYAKMDLSTVTDNSEVNFAGHTYVSNKLANALDGKPHIVAQGGNVTIAWVANAAGEVFGSTADILCVAASGDNGATFGTPSSFFNGGEIIQNLELGLLGGNATVAFTTDVRVNGKHSAYKTRYGSVAGGAAALKLFQNRSFQGLSFVKLPGGSDNSLLAYEQGNLYILNQLNAQSQPKALFASGVADLTSDYEIVGDKLIYASSKSNGQLIRSLSLAAQSAQSDCEYQPVSVETPMGHTAKTLATALGTQGKYTLIISNNMKVSGSNGQGVLQWDIYSDYADIALIAADYDVSKAAANSSFTMNVVVKNKGTDSVKGYKLSVVDKATGGVVYTNNKLDTLASGEAKSVPVTFTMGAINDYELKVEPYQNDDGAGNLSNAYTDADTRNNNHTLSLAYVDLSLETEIFACDEYNSLLAAVSNIGSKASSGSISIANVESPDTEIKSYSFSSIAAGGANLIKLAVMDDWFGEKDEVTFLCTVKSNEKDAYTYNNQSLITVKKSYHSYSVSYDLCGGKLSGDKQNPAKYDSQLGADLSSPEKTGYIFEAWYLSADLHKDGRMTRIEPGTAGNLKLYAGYTANTYKIQFNSNGGSGASTNQEMTYDVAAALTKNAYTKTGYIFTGWNTSRNGNGTAYTDGQSVSNLVAENGGYITLFAQWTPVNYAVQFNSNGGTGTMNPLAMTYGTSMRLPANTFSKKHYTFSGWNTKADGSGKSYSNGVGVSNLCDTKDGVVVLYAQWTPVKYTVTFQCNGGKINKKSKYTQAYSYGLAMKELPKAGKSKFELVGWYTKKSGGKKITAKTICNGKATYYAHWKKISVKAASISKVTKASKAVKGKKTVTLTLKKLSGVTGYQVQTAKTKDMKKASSKLSKSNVIKLTTLKAKNTYYVRVRAYKLDSTGTKIYGKWSKVKTVKL